MRFAMDKYSLEIEKSIFIDDAQILFDFVNNLFLMAAYSKLKIDKQTILLKEERLANINTKLKPNHLESNDIYNRILAVEGIRLRYINKIKNLKTMNDEKKV